MGDLEFCNCSNVEDRLGDAATLSTLLAKEAAEPKPSPILGPTLLQ